jgi:hypothetical protein
MNAHICIAAFTLGTLALSPIAAQTLSRRATVRGSDPNGKCTIEVEVDGAAEVEVTGDMGRIRTLSGGTAVWRRFECNGVLPRNPGDFRFTGIDGRGRMDLIADPRNRRGTAVVRIEDPKGGREGYTFDLEWRGGDGGPPFGDGRGRGDRPPDGRGRGDRPPDGLGRGDRPSDGRLTRERAFRICQDAVVERLGRDGYRDASFDRIDADNNPGRNDWIVGDVNGHRGRRRSRFSFSCSVDFSSGRVRSVDVRRR